jgi:hypothetical protein
MDIKNKTNRPLSISLPGGKTLHLGPRKKGQIAANAVDHPPVKKLVEAGEIEIADEKTGAFSDEGPGTKTPGGTERRAQGGGGGPRRSSGDR